MLRESSLIAKNPFISNLPFLTGFLEGVLGATLKTKIITAPIVFDVSK
jgi:hypothetical protein